MALTRDFKPTVALNGARAAISGFNRYCLEYRAARRKHASRRRRGSVDRARVGNDVQPGAVSREEPIGGQVYRHGAHSERYR